MTNFKGRNFITAKQFFFEAHYMQRSMNFEAHYMQRSMNFEAHYMQRFMNSFSKTSLN
jgi:hypothetical protein